MGFSQAQEKNNGTSYFLLNVGYANLNGNYFKLGPEFYLLNSKDWNIIGLSATANMAYFKDKFILIPEVGLAYHFNFLNTKANPYSSYMRATFYSARINASLWNITPEIGVNLLSLLEFTLGYSFEYQKNDYTNLEGLKLGVSLHLPTQLFF
ncbi:MAG: hypothetical protein RBT46_01800 [Weeksellaceae bacterium]|nr:hypothetical protein [Weeksellaceae bacterium]